MKRFLQASYKKASWFSCWKVHITDDFPAASLNSQLQVDTTVCRQIQILKEKQSTEITNVDMFPHGRRRYESAVQSAGLICLLSFSWKKPIWSEDHKKCVQEQESHIEETCVYKTDWISAANSEHLTVFLFHHVHYKNIFREKSFIQTTTSISDLLSAVRTQTFLLPIFVLAN